MPIEMPKGLPFSVDTWSSSSRRKQHHFLTHAHKDHSIGISTNFLSPIYSTHITKTLLFQQFPQVSSLSSLFVSIEVGQRLVIDDPDGTFSVTAFDANHCPGAVMFLFEGNFGNILHTGDCRLTPDCLQYLPEKYIGKKGIEPKLRLDYVFLDCTFGKSSIKIPSKYSAVRQVINCIWKHPDAPVVYLSCDLLGQEEILVEVSRIFGSKIYINRTDNAEFYQALMVIAPDILSEDASLRFQVFTGFPKLYERAKAKMMEAQANSEKEPLFIRPSTQWYACEDADIESQRKLRFLEAQRDPFGVWHVCYSMHSSREELEWALQLLQPKRVVSTTPSCRAMELNYVKKQCFGSQMASDDPLWKLLDISTEVGFTSSKTCSLAELQVNCVLSSPQEEDSPMATFVENKQLQSKDLSTSKLNCLKLSSPSKRPPITLFGRARLGLQDSHFLLKEKETEAIKMDCPQISSLESEKEESTLKQNGGGSVEVKFESSEEKRSNEMVENAFNFHFGSSKTLHQSLSKLYRSMNVPVPRPLPSLVDLLNSTKRARRF